MQEALRKIEENNKFKTKYLTLAGLGLTTIPHQITKLVHLELLDLACNQISKIENLSNLTNLQRLSLGENNISKIEGIGNLKSLNELFLHSNEIIKIEGIENLKHLEELNLSDNKVVEIEGLDNLKKLEILNLSNNLITDIKDVLGILEKIDKMVLEGNPLKYPPLEVFNKGIRTVKRYVKEAKRSGVTNVNAAKLLLTGSGEVGKTSLRIKLNNRKASLPKKDSRTKQVDVDQYTFKKKNIQENFTAFIWDFGGQQIIHHFHRFFMNKSALYLLITETSRDDDQLDYWLQTIQLYGKDSPILFVQNQMNSIPKSMDIKPFKAHFNIQDNIYKVDLLNNKGLDDLERGIQHHLQNLPFTKRTVPTSWFNINNVLQREAKERQSYFINFERFREICKEVADITAKESISDVGNFLHELGSILWYSQNPLLKQKIILERHWATEGIFKIIFDETISKTGKFSRDDAEKIWECDEAFCFHTGDLIEMMREFKICIPTRTDPNQYLIPALLKEFEPENIKWHYPKRLVVEYQYETILPRGLVNHLSAEMSNLIQKDDHVWNTGVWLNDTNAQAKITENRFKRKIKIELAGESYRELFGAIKDKMDIIQKDYGELSYKLMIPCICDICSKWVELGEQQYFAYNELLRRKEINKPTIECSISCKDVSIQELSDNIEVSKTTDYINIFISYALEDLQYKNRLVSELKPFLKDKKMAIWTYDEILPGQNPKVEIETNLNKSILFLLLISPNFFSSERITEIEVPIIIKRRKNKGCWVIPIIARPTASWENCPFFFLEAIPKYKGKLKPISLWKDEERDIAWKAVADAIKNF